MSRALNTPVGLQIHELAGGAGSSDVLPPLAAVLREKDPSQRHGKLSALAAALPGAPPRSLSALILSRCSVEDRSAGIRDGSWPYGSHFRRAMLIEEMIQRAQALGSTSAEDATTHALGAMFFAAQEYYFFGTPIARKICFSAELSRLLRWDAERLAKLKAILTADHEITESIVAPLRSAVTALESLIAAGTSQVDRQVTTTCLSSLDEMTGWIANRPDLQWRVANLTWRLANFARVSSANDVLETLKQNSTRWAQAVNDHEFPRWISDAITRPGPTPKSAGLRFVSAAVIKSRQRKT